MRNAGLNEAQAAIKIAGGNINNLRYTDDTTLMEESEEKLKSLLMKVKEESFEKVGLKLNIHKTRIMASGPITSWQIDWETMETMTDFILGGSKITADSDTTLLTRIHLVKAMVFLVVMNGCERWTIKKAECRRIDAFELWCWRRLESSLDCKEIQSVYSGGDQPWAFFGRNDAKAETPVLWPPHGKS